MYFSFTIDCHLDIHGIPSCRISRDDQLYECFVFELALSTLSHGAYQLLFLFVCAILVILFRWMQYLFVAMRL